MTIRLLHVGLGRRGRHWLDIVAAHPAFTSVGGVDDDPAALAAARQVRSAANVTMFNDLTEAISSSDADAALIASPSSLHSAHTMSALDAGLAVLVETPFAPNPQAAAEVLARQQSTGKPVIVAENFRFAPAERTLRDLVHLGTIGEIRTMTVVDRRLMPANTQGSWMAEMDYPQLREIAVHHFDSIRCITGGAALSISARTWNPSGSDYQHGANTEALIAMEDGVSVQYLGTLTSHRDMCSFAIEGEDGTLWSNRRWVFLKTKSKRFFRPVRLASVPKGDAEPYPRQGTTSLLNSLREAIDDGTAAETSASDNIWTIAMLEAAQRSDLERRSVPITEVHQPEPE